MLRNFSVSIGIHREVDSARTLLNRALLRRCLFILEVNFIEIFVIEPFAEVQDWSVRDFTIPDLFLISSFQRFAYFSALFRIHPNASV